MVELPSSIASSYRPATSQEVRSWSFGRVGASRPGKADDWRELRRTLGDQAIFGPTETDKCACGKCSGPQQRNMICDHCGVKVTSSCVRRERFGHIELGQELRHPFGNDAEPLSAFPVLPAAFVESPGGRRLADIYEAIIEAIRSCSFQQAAEGLDDLIRIVLPALVSAQAWRLEEAAILARGVALECLRDDLSAHEIA